MLMYNRLIGIGCDDGIGGSWFSIDFEFKGLIVF